jgi:hypothetical protein
MKTATRVRPKVVGYWAMMVTPQMDMIKYGRNGDVKRPYKTPDEALDTMTYLYDNYNDCRFYMLKVFNTGHMVTYELDYDAVVVGVSLNDIDEGIRALILDLNRRGYKTVGCCQGKTEKKQFAKNGKHNATAYIGFLDSIPDEIVDKMKKMDLYVYDGTKKNTGVASTAEHHDLALSAEYYGKYSPGLRIALTEANLAFEAKIRKAFLKCD